MKILFFLMTFLVSNSAFAGMCGFSLNQAEVHVGDRNIFFGEYLRVVLEKSGYHFVDTNESVGVQITITYKEVPVQRFQHAQAFLEAKSLVDGSVISTSADVTCFTQSCIAKDAAKVIKKSIDLLGKKIPTCSE